jgi:hypothetical protein
MEDREIVQKIKSFPRWHYQFDLNGHLTPIYFVWEKQRYETKRSVIRRSIASQYVAAARGILPSVSSPWDASREAPLSIELSSRPILVEGKGCYAPGLGYTSATAPICLPFWDIALLGCRGIQRGNVHSPSRPFGE